MNMKIAEFINYRDFLRAHVKSLPHNGKGELLRIAKTLGVQSSLISQVLRGPRNFTLEQASELAHYLELSADEIEYFLLLVQYERANSDRLKKSYKRQLNKMKSALLSLTIDGPEFFHLAINEKEQFYANWHYVAVWLLSAVPGPNTAAEFSKRLALPIAQIEDALEFLVHSKLCLLENGKVIAGPVRTHLEGSELLRRNHHMNWRVKGMNKILQPMAPQDFYFSFPMCLSSEDARVVKDMFSDFIKRVDKVIAPSKPEKVFCLNFDWFEL